MCAVSAGLWHRHGTRRRTAAKWEASARNAIVMADSLTPAAAATPRFFGVGGRRRLGRACSLQHDQGN